MISCAEAQQLIGGFPVQISSECVPLGSARGRILAEALVADRDGPPFHRVAMDGIAMDSAAYGRGQRKFNCVALQAAGSEPLKLNSTLSCIEAMTGAVLPLGCDAVIPFEKCSRIGDDYIAEDLAMEAWTNIHCCGSDFKQGQSLLAPGTLLRSPECAVAASLGYSKLNVRCGPRIAIVTTGSELVDVEVTPLPYQIRKSNIHAAHWALQQRGFSDVSLFHLSDELVEMEQKLDAVLAKVDVLIISGGVSKGKLDFVPQVLANLNVNKVFHNIAQKPGKPMWFGVKDRHVVFALPGNPASMLVCLERYVIPQLLTAMGQSSIALRLPSMESLKPRPNLTLFKTVQIKTLASGGSTVVVQKNNGSGDYASLCGGDGFIEIPPAAMDYPAGTNFRFYPWS